MERNNLALDMVNYVNTLKKGGISHAHVFGNALAWLISHNLYTQPEVDNMIELLLNRSDERFNEALRHFDERTLSIRDHLSDQRLETERFLNERRLQVEHLLGDLRLEMRDLEGNITRTITSQVTRNITFLISLLTAGFAALHYLHLV